MELNLIASNLSNNVTRKFNTASNLVSNSPVSFNIDMNVKEEHENVTNNRVTKVYYSIKPAIVLENMCGIFRFRLFNGKLMPLSWKMKAFSVLPVVINIVLFYLYFNRPTMIAGAYNFVDMMDEVPSIVTLVQYVTSAITASFLLHAPNIRIFNTFAELDAMLHVDTFPDFYKQSRSETIVFLLVLAITHTINFLLDLLTANEITMYQFVVIPLYFLQKLEILTFCKLIAMLRTRLSIINVYLSTFIEKDLKIITIFTFVREKKSKSEKRFNFIGRASPDNLKIRDLATMYDTIGKICSMVNTVFNFQIFMTLVSTFTFIVITIWTSLYYYRTPENNSGHLVNIVIWCFSIVHTVAIMSIACERLLLVRNATKILVNKVIMDYDLPKTMRVQAKAFMELVEAWPLRIYIYDMFSIDITLMLKFISVATTYLIVIIQISHFI